MDSEHDTIVTNQRSRGITVHNYTKKPRKSYNRSTSKEKLQVVLEVLENGRHRKELAKERDIALNSINIWVRNYQLYGEEGLSSNKRTAYVAQEETQKELKRLKKIEKRYKEQLEEIEILKKFQAFLRGNE